MVTEVTFNSRDEAGKIRNDPQYKPFLADEDDGRQAVLKLKDNTPEPALNDITGEAADSKRHKADKAGQADLTRKEREEIDFTREGVNVPKVRSIKAIAGNVGVSDYRSFADFTLSVDENRSLLKEATTEEQGKSDLGRDELSDAKVDQKLANAYDRQRNEQIPQAKDFALIETDEEAQSFVQERAEFDIGFTRRGQRIQGQGEDFDRLEKRHEDRSERAQRVDERRSAKITRNPIQWANNPNQWDYPGIDTVQPQELHEQRSERAQRQDEQEIAPTADSKEQWANNQGQYDWPGVDRPDAYGPTGNATIPESERNATDQFQQRASEADISLAPDEALNFTGAVSPYALGGNDEVSGGERAPKADLEAPPEAALQEQSGIMDNFTDDRDEDGQLTDFGMNTDATQHRESKTEGEKASSFGVDDRDDASRGAENDTDAGEQQGFEVFGGGVRENETLF